MMQQAEQRLWAEEAHLQLPLVKALHEAAFVCWSIQHDARQDWSLAQS